MVTYEKLWETLKQKNIRKHNLMEMAEDALCRCPEVNLK